MDEKKAAKAAAAPPKPAKKESEEDAESKLNPNVCSHRGKDEHRLTSAAIL